MSDVTSRYDQAVPAGGTPVPAIPLGTGVTGYAHVALASGKSGTALAGLRQRVPLRVLFPLPAAGDPLTAALCSVSGGVVGGDRLSLDLAVGAGAAGLFVAQAAEKVYRSTGADSHIDMRLSVGPGGWMEVLPQETILFDGARLCRRTVADVAPGGTLMAGEILVFGRIARGERMRTGLISDSWRIARDGRLAWYDALRLDGDIARHLDAPAGFGGAHGAATLLMVVDDPRRLLPVLRSCPCPPAVKFGASIVNGMLIGRWLGTDGMTLRRSFATAWSTLRGAAGGWPRSLPRLWHI